MAVIEEHAGAEGNEEECAGEDALKDRVTESIQSLEIVSTFTAVGDENAVSAIVTTSLTADGDGDQGEADDEEDDEAVWGGGGLSGFVQKPEDPRKILRQYFPSKVGGAPAWLDPLNLPTGDHILCGICDKPMRFVLQVYGPAENDDDAFHRTLFVFMCNSLACLQQDDLQQRRLEKRLRSVKVFRSQLPRENPFYSKDPPNPNGSELPLTDGAPLCSWCGTWKGNKVCGGCKRTRYCSQLHQMDHWRVDHAPFCRRIQEELKTASVQVGDGATSTARNGDANPPPVAPNSSHLWPEFELIVEDAAGYEEEGDGEENSDAGNRTGRLLEDYERRRSQGGEFSANDVQGVEESSPEEQQWALFQAKVSDSPEQVLWYLRSKDAKPLWPKVEGQPKNFDIPMCPHCWTERTFEFQILPQLLYFFGVQDGPDSLDWGTIAVYSCKRSCKVQGYSEEFAWVQPGFS